MGWGRSRTAQETTRSGLPKWTMDSALATFNFAARKLVGKVVPWDRVPELDKLEDAVNDPEQLAVMRAAKALLPESMELPRSAYLAFGQTYTLRVTPAGGFMAPSAKAAAYSVNLTLRDDYPEVKAELKAVGDILFRLELEHHLCRDFIRAVFNAATTVNQVCRHLPGVVKQIEEPILARWLRPGIGKPSRGLYFWNADCAKMETFCTTFLAKAKLFDSDAFEAWNNRPYHMVSQATSTPTVNWSKKQLEWTGW